MVPQQKDRIVCLTTFNARILLVCRGLHTQVAAALARLDVCGLTEHSKVCMTCEDDVLPLDTHHQPSALHQAVSLLQPHLNPATTQLTIYDAIMSDALSTQLAAMRQQGWSDVSLSSPCVPADTDITTPLPHLRELYSPQFDPIGPRTSAEPVTDQDMTQLLQCVTSVDTLSVSELKLRTALPQGTRLPWRTVKVTREADLNVWLQQARLLGEQTSWKLDSLRIKLAPEQVSLAWPVPLNTSRTHCMSAHMSGLMWGVG